MIKYYKLFDLLNRKGMKKTDLLEIISAPTLAKLSKGDIIKTDIIDRICEYLKCQPDDIMEHVYEETRENEILITKGNTQGYIEKANGELEEKPIAFKQTTVYSINKNDETIEHELIDVKWKK